MKEEKEELKSVRLRYVPSVEDRSSARKGTARKLYLALWNTYRHEAINGIFIPTENIYYDLGRKFPKEKIEINLEALSVCDFVDLKREEAQPCLTAAGNNFGSDCDA